MNTRRLKTNRSTEAPMDFEFTSRSSLNTRPIWATEYNVHTPRKRTLTDMNPPRPMFPPSSPTPPTFGANTNVPFIFQSPMPHTSHPPPWVPPPANSPNKPMEVPDVDMSETSPLKQEDTEKPTEEDTSRAISLGGIRRVFRSRHAKVKSRKRTRVEEDVEGSDSQSDIEDDRIVRASQTTSNHYTLNMPSPPTPKSELPYILSGYLQFFFNLCLILLFLYLLIQSIVTIQRDVEQKISEYSMEIVQEIANCALMFKNNHCPGNIIPHMVRPCSEWEMCMNRDPTRVGRARIGAELIAEILNGFVEPISWKTLGFTLASLSFLTVFMNTVFSFYRSRLQTQHEAMAVQPVATPYGLGGWGGSRHGEYEMEAEMPSRKRRLEGGGVAKI